MLWCALYVTFGYCGDVYAMPCDDILPLRLAATDQDNLTET